MPTPRPYPVNRYEPLWTQSIFTNSNPGGEDTIPQSEERYRLLGIGGSQESLLVYVADLKTGETHEVSRSGTDLELIQIVIGLGDAKSQVEIRNGSNSYWARFNTEDTSLRAPASHDSDEAARQALIRKHIERQRQRQRATIQTAHS